MTPTLIGYFPKRTMKRPDWLPCPDVEEICSVSGCMSEEPDDWIGQWRHNECWCFDTEELAWSVVPEEARAEFEVYAYRMYPVRFVNGREEPIEFPTLNVAPLTRSFHQLGYDVVSRTYAASFECSPLSCNAMAESHAVNRHCLVDSEQDAQRLAVEFSVSEPEPGPYYLIEVWRRTGQ